MTDIKILPCTVSDGASIGRHKVTSFWTDPSWAVLWHGKTCEYVAEQCSLRMPLNFLDGRSRNRHLKAVDSRTGNIVGYARWALPPVDGVEGMWAEAVVPAGQSAEELEEAERRFASADWRHDSSFDALDVLVREAKGRWLKPEKDIVLDWLSVDPDCRHQGIATMLVNYGIREANKLGFRTFIHSMKGGRGVYLKTGFKLVEELVQDDSKYGGNGECIAYIMIKEPDHVG